MPSSWSRRAVLVTGASASSVALAGCTVPIGAQDRPTGEPTHSPEPVLRRVEVARPGDIPPDADVDLDVAMLEPTVTRSHPARLRIAFTNTAAVGRRFTFGSGPPFTQFGSVEPADGPRLLLLPADTAHEKVTPDCWRPATETIFVVASIQRKLTLQPGETIAAEEAVWDSNQNEGDDCLVPGSYRFENGYGLPDGTTFDWGFSLDVERP